MPTVDEVVRDPEFQGLPWGERHKVLKTIDPDFAALPPGEQGRAMNGLKQMPFWGGGKAVASPGTSKVPSPEPPGLLNRFVQNPVMTTGSVVMGGLEKLIPGRQAEEQTFDTVYNKVKDNSNSIARTGISGLSALAGGVLGAPGGPLGIGAGGALGYGMGQQLSDIVLGDRPTSGVGGELWQGAKDIGEGALYELATPAMVGAAKVGSGTLQAIVSPKQTLRKVGEAAERMSQRQAGRQIAAARTTSPETVAQLEKNREINQAVEDAIPGFKFTTAQKTGDPNLLALTRVSTQGNKPGAVYANETTMQQNAALEDYVQKHIRGGGDINSLLVALKGQQDDLVKGVKSAITGAENEVAGLGTGLRPQESGEVLSAAAKTAQNAARAKSKALYDAVPMGTPLDSMPLYQGIKKEFAENDPEYGRIITDLNNIMRRAKGGLTPEPSPILGPDGLPANQARLNMDVPNNITVGQLKDFRSQVATKYREAVAAKDFEGARRYSNLMDHIGATEDLAVQTGKGEGIDALRAARDNYRNEYIPTFRQGATSKVLAVDKTGGARVVDSAVAGEYFKPGTKGVPEAAESFKRTFGNNTETKVAITDYARQSLLNHLEKTRNPVTGEFRPGAVKGWLNQHKTALESHGLQNEFSTVEKALAQADKAKGVAEEFNRSALGKVLDGMNVESAIPSIMERRDSQRLISQLVDIAQKKDPSGAALKGLKAAIGDYFQGVTHNVTRDLANQELSSLAKVSRFMKQHDRVLRRVYSPKEMKAFENVHKALVGISKQAQPVPGFNNSATADLLNRLIKAPGLDINSRIIRGVMSIALNRHAVKVDEMVTRAMFDPAYAEKLTSMAANVRVKYRQNPKGLTLEEIEKAMKLSAEKEESIKSP